MLPKENELRDCIEKFVETSNSIIKQLEALKIDIRKHHTNCNKARTVGTSVSTIGSVTAIACFIAAPFTLGATLPFAVAGTIAGAAGGITNVTTSITDMIKSKNYKAEIERIGNERNEVAKELQEHLETLNRVALELEEKGLDTDTAYKLAFTYAKFGFNTFMFKKNAITIAVGIMDSVKLVEQASTAGSIGTVMGIASLGKGGVRIEYGTTFALVGTLSKLGIEVGKTAKEVISGLVTGVSLVFIVTDIVFLVRDWQNEHPTVDCIDRIIESLEKELEPVKELLEYFVNE